MTANATENCILVGNRFLNACFLGHIPSDNGEAGMQSWHRGWVAREGCDVVSLIQGLFNQASTSEAGGSKDHNMHEFLPPCSLWGVSAAPQIYEILWNEASVAARTTLEGSWLAPRGSDWPRMGRRTLQSAGGPA